MSIPLRNFGKTGVQISALGLGGHHLGGAKDEKTAIEIVRRALDGGITFYDNAWEYNRGKTESWLGLGLKGWRDKIFLMTKVCTHGRDATLATQMLEQSLRRLQTDYLDLWQIHGVVFQNDPELFIRPGGAAEALRKAKEQGKVRFVGFIGHKDPDVHLAMLNIGFPFDSVQMPLNAFDATYSMSFEQKVLPVLNQRGIAPLGMKPISGHGDPVQMGVLTAREALRYAMSLPVACTISGAEELHIIEQNLEIAQNFVPMSGLTFAKVFTSPLHRVMRTCIVTSSNGTTVNTKGARHRKYSRSDRTGNYSATLPRRRTAAASRHAG